MVAEKARKVTQSAKRAMKFIMYCTGFTKFEDDIMIIFWGVA